MLSLSPGPFAWMVPEISSDVVPLDRLDLLAGLFVLTMARGGGSGAGVRAVSRVIYGTHPERNEQRIIDVPLLMPGILDLLWASALPGVGGKNKLFGARRLIPSFLASDLW